MRALKVLFLIVTIQQMVFTSLICKNVAVIGTGYVGLVAGCGLASLGHNVICVDNDELKIKALNLGRIPIYEPGLPELATDMISLGRLSFTTDSREAIINSEIILIAIGTPMGQDGSADLTALMEVMRDISLHVRTYTIICTKSTVPVGTNRLIEKRLQQDIPGKFDLVFNPEFLRQGSALTDFLYNNPIVLGTASSRGLAIMKELYAPMIERGTSLISTTIPAAEMIKYAWNCYSAIKIAYVNELSHFCNAIGADITSVIKGMSFSDRLLPMSSIVPGPGIGGSCLPKDTQAFIAMTAPYGCQMSIVQAAITSNHKHTQKIISSLYELLDTGKKDITVAVLGLSFKPNTDDVRYSPALPVFERLLRDGIRVQAYDPQAIGHMKKLFPQAIYCNSPYSAVTGADAVILLTDWNECKQIQLERMAHLVRRRVVVDTRNMWDPEELKRYDFICYNLGRS
jgi:UDPglucose 6-dehydrogenase